MLGPLIFFLTFRWAQHSSTIRPPCCHTLSAAGAKSLLESPVMKHEGLVPWWRHRDRQESAGVERWRPHDVEDGERGSQQLLKR